MPCNFNDLLCAMLGKKTGGRQKGSVNKVTNMSKAVISDLLTNYNSSGLMESDFMQLDGKDRITIAEKLMQYVMPKMQSVQGDIETHVKPSVADKLRQLSSHTDQE